MALGLENGIAVALSQNGFGVLYDQPSPTIFVGEEPPEPDDIVTVFEAGGGPVERVTETHVITIRTRGTSYEAVTEKARDIHAFLNSDYGGVFGGFRVARVKAGTPPVPIGRDDGGDSGGRWRVTQSFSVITKSQLAFI